MYLECQVQASPRPHKVLWEKDVSSCLRVRNLISSSLQGEPIRQDLSGGIILSNLSLVIQHITPAQSGNYTCKATNTEGAAASNTLPLHIECKVSVTA